MPTFTSKKKLSEAATSTDDSKNSLFSKSNNDNETECRKFIEDEPKWKLEQITLNPKVRETILDVITFCENKDRN